MAQARLAYILCAGEGRRLRPLTERWPKPLLPLVDRPLVLHTMDALREAGVVRFLVNLYHLGEVLRAALQRHADAQGASIDFLAEPRLLGTGGALRNARPRLREPFFLVNGDFVAPGFSFADLEAAHRGLATLAVRPLAPGAAFNPVGVDAKGRLVRVQGAFGSGGNDHQFLGVQRLEPEALDHLSAAESFSVFGGFYDRLRAAGLAMGTYLSAEAFGGDAGTREGYLEANRFLLERQGRSHWGHPDLRLEQGAELGAGAVLGRGVHVGAGAHVGNAVLLPDSEVAPGARVRNAIVAGHPPGDVIDAIFVNGKETVPQ